MCITYTGIFFTCPRLTFIPTRSPVFTLVVLIKTEHCQGVEWSEVLRVSGKTVPPASDLTRVKRVFAVLVREQQGLRRNNSPF